MRAPKTENEKKLEQTFASAHETVRRRGGTGSVRMVGDGDGGAVFLDGVVVYARHGREVGADALESLAQTDDRVRMGASKRETVRMFRTYLEYLEDDGLVAAEPLDSSVVGRKEVEGVLVDGIRNEPQGSWRGQTNPVDRSIFPEGRRVALVTDLSSLRAYVDDGGVSGYAVGDGEVVTFRNGSLVDKRDVDIDAPVRNEVGAGGGWVVVDSDTETGADSSDSDGILGRIF